MGISPLVRTQLPSHPSKYSPFPSLFHPASPTCTLIHFPKLSLFPPSLYPQSFCQHTSRPGSLFVFCFNRLHYQKVPNARLRIADTSVSVPLVLELPTPNHDSSPLHLCGVIVSQAQVTSHGLDTLGHFTTYAQRFAPDCWFHLDDCKPHPLFMPNFSLDMNNPAGPLFREISKHWVTVMYQVGPIGIDSPNVFPNLLHFITRNNYPVQPPNCDDNTCPRLIKILDHQSPGAADIPEPAYPGVPGPSLMLNVIAASSTHSQWLPLHQLARHPSNLTPLREYLLGNRLEHFMSDLQIADRLRGGGPAPPSPDAVSLSVLDRPRIIEFNAIISHRWCRPPGLIHFLVSDGTDNSISHSIPIEEALHQNSRAVVAYLRDQGLEDILSLLPVLGMSTPPTPLSTPRYSVRRRIDFPESVKMIVDHQGPVQTSRSSDAVPPNINEQSLTMGCMYNLVVMYTDGGFSITPLTQFMHHLLQPHLYYYTHARGFLHQHSWSIAREYSTPNAGPEVYSLYGLQSAPKVTTTTLPGQHPNPPSDSDVSSFQPDSSSISSSEALSYNDSTASNDTNSYLGNHDNWSDLFFGSFPDHPLWGWSPHLRHWVFPPPWFHRVYDQPPPPPEVPPFKIVEYPILLSCQTRNFHARHIHVDFGLNSESGPLVASTWPTGG
jgi:hypothetical protein